MPAGRGNDGLRGGIAPPTRPEETPIPVTTDIDLSDLSNFEEGPPWHLFAQLREEAPVHWNPLREEAGFWSLTRYEDIAMASQDHQTFSSGRRGVFIRDEQVLPWEIAQTAMINQDPPRHAKVRGIVQRVFTGGTVAAQEPAIRRLTGELVDGVIERGACDLVADIAVDLPLIVIADMIGVPREDQPTLLDWAHRIGDLAGADDQTLREQRDDGLQAFGEMGAYLLNLVGERRSRPADDLLSRLIAAEVEGERLDDISVTSFVGFLMSAGSEETRNTFSGGALVLAEHPEQRQALIERPELLPAAIEEILRWHSAILHMRRTVTRDVEIRGVRIEEGSKVVMWYASGNRDESVYEDPDTFDIHRVGPRHQAFGGGGRHFCLGNQLARLELRILLAEMLRRMPDLALAGPIERKRSNFFHGITKMPVSFTPGRPESA